jgi:SAM-dependent methyltransferase
MYINKKGGKFSKFYTSDYKARIKKIYHPKLTFVKNIIPKIHSLLDLGCGAGHFVKACEEKSIKATGYDVNKTSIDYGKKLLTKNKIFSFNQEDIFLKIKNSKDTVITMFGVIEHLQKPYKIFSSFNESKAKYLVISVPTFSLTVLMEHVFQNVYPRQLGGVHTHLYTNQSLNYIFNKFKLRIVGEWWFGTDLMDFKRSIISSDQKNKKFSKIVNNYFKDITDEMQNSIDKKKISSEAHIILKKK